MSNLNKANAFTLVEMLVVIAIIGILAALMMPGLRNAVDAAKLVNCSNNLRQCYTATGIYLEDNNSRMIMYLRTSWNSEGFWTSFLCGLQGTANGSSYADGTDYIENRRLMLCPDNPEYKRELGVGGKMGAGANWYGYGVVNNSGASDQSFYRKTNWTRPYDIVYRMSGVKRAGDLPLYLHSSYWKSTGKWSKAIAHRNDANGIVYLQHQNRTPAIFFDGHCEVADEISLNETEAAIRKFRYQDGAVITLP